MFNLIRFELKYIFTPIWVKVTCIVGVLTIIGLTIAFTMIDEPFDSTSLNAVVFVLSALFFFIAYSLPFTKNASASGRHYNRLSQILPVTSRQFTGARYFSLILVSQVIAIITLSTYILTHLIAGFTLQSNDVIQVYFVSISPYLLLGSLYLGSYFCLPRYDVVSMLIYFPSVFVPLGLSNTEWEPLLFTVISSVPISATMFSVSFLISLLMANTRHQRQSYN